MKNIAFIGLGSMGGPMAANLVKAGYTVRGFDVSDFAKEKATEAGVTLFDTAVEATEGADAVITMLPTAQLVADTLAELVTKVENKPAVFIDSSTIGVTEARKHAELISQAGSTFLDAPVSGGHGGAVAGTLAIMVGGDEETFTSVRPVFDAMGDAITYCGKVGNGQGVKICNNMVLGIHQIALAEAFLLGERIGLDSQTIYDVISNSTGNSWALQEHAPAKGIDKGFPADNDFEATAPAALIAKDLGFAKEAFEATGTASVLGIPAAQLFADFNDSGRGKLDMSGVVLELAERSENKNA
ncbi:3-hydroxyisobutyrate dehydrogenase [Corynebacterium tapiri]|uniref:3-hydroxyisobutyrate dehydrogenase n=1 Tax=Corynebacterium tapiri TaxID=1448266 RepID=A0A5C4U610_9CORY|nr:3-hydroxyisobutyrate dehydrogenase [Corynebacterium tapiri]TNL99332.1 3-hydroxyisobutyrate dehydrogenase [Corynebacterium tapiri]